MLESLDILISFVLIMLIVSMLITVSVQFVSALLNLRGRNLARGLVETFKVASPNFPDDWTGLVNHILQAPILSDAAFRFWPQVKQLASAARPNELFDCVHRIATGNCQHGDLSAADLNTFRDQAQALLVALGVPQAALDRAGSSAQAIGASLSDIDAAMRAAIAALPQQDQAAIGKALTGPIARLQTYAGSAEAEAARQVDIAATDLVVAYNRFQYLYNIGQERATAWFSSHARLVTVLFAAAFTLFLQLDSLEIFKFVSNSQETREKIAAQASVAAASAQKIIGDSRTVQQDAITAFAASVNDPARKAQLLNLAKDPPPKAEDVRADVGKIIESSTAATLADFDTVFDKTTQDDLDKGAREFHSLAAALDNTGFDLFPPTTLNRWHHGWWSGLWAHSFGMLCSIGLLSLGAPFWFNSLSALTNLRSAVADNIDTEKTATGKPGASGNDKGVRAPSPPPLSLMPGS